MYEALFRGGLSEEEELIGWELSREEAVVSGEVEGGVKGAGNEVSGSGDVGKEAVESGEVGGEVEGVEDGYQDQVWNDWGRGRIGCNF